MLLVEDNAEVAEVCTAYFQQFGYAVKRAGSAQEALEILENESGFDLVFSDILMPGFMNGLELAHGRARANSRHLPVLLSTGYSTSAQDAIRQGFIVLQKPFDLAALEKSLCARSTPCSGSAITSLSRRRSRSAEKSGRPFSLRGRTITPA